MATSSNVALAAETAINCDWAQHEAEGILRHPLPDRAEDSEYSHRRETLEASHSLSRDIEPPLDEFSGKAARQWFSRFDQLQTETRPQGWAIINSFLFGSGTSAPLERTFCDLAVRLGKYRRGPLKHESLIGELLVRGNKWLLPSLGLRALDLFPKLSDRHRLVHLRSLDTELVTRGAELVDLDAEAPQISFDDHGPCLMALVLSDRLEVGLGAVSVPSLALSLPSPRHYSTACLIASSGVDRPSRRVRLPS